MKDYIRFGLCETCGNKFVKTCLLQSTNNTFYCTDCFKSKYCSSTNPMLCKYYEHRQRKLFPNPEIYVYRPPKTLKNISRYDRRNSQSVMSLSKKPLQCPHSDCNKYVSVFTLESHFKYEHKEVPIIFTQFDARSALEFSPRAIRYDVTQCIVLLNVIGRNATTLVPNHVMSRETCHINSHTDEIESKPVMVLLATRLASFQLANEYEREELDRLSNIYEDDDFVLRLNDKIIIWLASNVTTNYNYTVAASTLNNDIRIKYFGPLSSIGDSSVKVCNDGRCLILNHYHCMGMSENGNKPLALDIVIHEE